MSQQPRKLYYGRISTTDGQSSASQHEDAKAHGVGPKDVFIDEGVSGYHVAQLDRPQWAKVEHDLRHGGTLIVRWLDRISRNYDELHTTMQRLMKAGVRVECTLNGMVFDGAATDAIAKATRDAVLAFMAAQGEADYLNRREMQARGIALAKERGGYIGREREHSYEDIRNWRAEHKASISQTAEHFGIGAATVKRAMVGGAIVRHEDMFLDFIQKHGVGKNDHVASSPKSYVSYLRAVARLLGQDITPALLCAVADVDRIASQLEGQREAKTISNYKSAMNQYAEMVKEYGLSA